MADMLTTIGAISGTSMDGIDLAVLETDGHEALRFGPGATLPYPAELKRDLLALLADPSIAERDPLADLDRRVTEAFTDAIARFMADHAIAPDRVDLIGLHGQTVYHRPERRFTRQLGRGGEMAEALGIAVVDAFRQADVASGGHGAPLVPLYHAALVAGLPRPLMVLNLGGVANVTYVGEDTILAFDTGPASALVDDAVRKRFGLPYDEGGAIAARGRVDEAMVAGWMQATFFAKAPPKSLDRQDFHRLVRAADALPDEDAVATLAEFTIRATVAALEHVPRAPLRWLVAGGGRHNLTFMRGLARRLGVPVEPVEVLGWQGDLIEAQCFGYLAARSRLGLPLSLPGTTGVPRPMPGGVFWPAPAGRAQTTKL